MSTYKVGKIVTCNVTCIEKYGAFVNLDEYYNGLIHISEISDNYIRNIEDYIKVGDKIKAEIIGIDNVNHHINLSIKNTYYLNNSKSSNLIEVGSGFKILEDNLQKWIEMKKK